MFGLEKFLKRGYKPPKRVEEGMIRLKKPNRETELNIRGFGNHRVMSRHMHRAQDPNFGLPFSKKGK